MVKLIKEFDRNDKNLHLKFEQPKMREKLSSLLFVGAQLAAGVLLLIQFLKVIIDVSMSDENKEDYIAFSSVFFSVLLTMLVILHNSYGIAREQIE